MGASSAQAPGVIRFGVFELDVRSGELRKSGVRVNIQDQPLKVLECLLERPGALVTREELRTRLWAWRHVRRLRAGRERRSPAAAGCAVRLRPTRRDLSRRSRAAAIDSSPLSSTSELRLSSIPWRLRVVTAGVTRGPPLRAFQRSDACRACEAF
jgi:hypothetical protein